eukprot:1140847-Pelagomonas_calceolata.AAC.3
MLLMLCFKNAYKSKANGEIRLLSAFVNKIRHPVERKEKLHSQRKLSPRKGGTLAQKSHESPPPQGCRKESVDGDLEGNWKHPAPEPACEALWEYFY